jgi:hypothetical protein
MENVSQPLQSVVFSEVIDMNSHLNYDIRIMDGKGELIKGVISYNTKTKECFMYQKDENNRYVIENGEVKRITVILPDSYLTFRVLNK